MIAWSYATAGEFDEDVFRACCNAALANFESYDMRVTTPAAWPPYSNTVACHECCLSFS